MAFARLFHATFYTGVINQQLYNYIIRTGNALERFMQRSQVVDGKLKFTVDAVRNDAAAFAEMDRLLECLHRRIRDRLAETGSRGLERLG